MDLRALAAAAAAAAGAVIVVGLVTLRAGELEPLPDAGDASANHLAHMMVASIEHEMTGGEPLATAALVERISRRLSDVDIEVYDPRGRRVYGGVGRAPNPRDMPPLVVAALTDGQRRVGADNVVYRPIPAEPACADCHDDGADLRGVFELTLAPDACTDSMVGELLAFESIDPPPEGTLSGPCDLEAALDYGLRQIMLAKRGRLALGLFDRAALTPAVERVVVYDNAGRLRYDTAPADPPALVGEALDAARRTDAIASDGARHTVVLPMLQQESCARCHGNESAVRGAVSITVNTPAVEAPPTSALGRAGVVAVPAAAAAVLFGCAALLVIRRRTGSGPRP